MAMLPALALRVAGRLLDTINDILDFSKIQAGMLKLEETDFQLTELVQKEPSPLLPMMQARDLKFHACLGSAPRFLRGDRKKLAQALINYLGAKKATAAWSIGLNCQKVEDTATDGLLRFEVTDNREEEHFLAQGTDDCIVKPVSLEELSCLLNGWADFFLEWNPLFKYIFELLFVTRFSNPLKFQDI